ncbi:MAG: hypothetical protein BWK80_07415 [Desulfobacteraceae bacterium IS3]|nr:MAG: hypothetical protein BWK80_07415 [Desulfobacteraceae bacterium IS3]
MKKVLGITGLLILLAVGTAYSQTTVADMYSYYLPYFTELSGTWTGLGLRNSDSAEAAHVSVIVYGQNGNPAATTEKILAPGGQDAFVAGSGKGNEGWIRVNSDRPLTGLCFFGTTGEGSHMADITLIPDLSKILHVPHVGQNYQWDTAIMVCNPNPVAASVTLTFRDKDGQAISPRSYTIPADGSAAYNVSDLTGNTEYVNGSVELSADQGIAAFALYTDLKWNKGMSFAGISAVIPEPQAQGESYEYYLPYFTEGSDNWTGLGLRNSGDSQNANITVTVADQNGNASDPIRKVLSSKGQDAFVVSSSSGKEGWIRVNSDSPLTGLCFFGTTGQGSHMADITLIPDLSKTLYVPHVGQNYQWDTTIMVCNPNASAASLSLTFRDKDGQALSPRSYTIAAGGSGKYKVADLTGNTEYVNGSVEISADQGVAAFALYTDLKWNKGMSFAGISAVSPMYETGDGGNADYPRTGNQDFKVAQSEKSDPLFGFRSSAPASNLLSSKQDYAANLPNVRDQGSTGSCTAWATGYYYKTWQEAVEEHWDKNQNAFSPMYLFAMQCRTFEEPYDMTKSWEILKRYGCARLITVPFKEYESWSDSDEKRKYASVSLSDAAHEEAKIYRSGEMARFGSLSEVRQALSSGPVVMGINRYERMPSDWSPSPERNYLSPDSSNYNGGHAILCVGYDDSKFGVGAVKLVNSWGTQWGEKGYTWIKYPDFDDIVLYAMSVKDLPNPKKPSEETKKKPDAPSDVRATDAAGPYVDITWSNVSNAQYYRIFRAEIGKSSTYSEIASVYNTSYRDFPEPGIVFYYSVVSYNDIGNSDHFASDTDAKSYVDRGSARGNTLLRPKVLWISNDDQEMSSSFTVSNIDSGAEAMEVLVANSSDGPWDSFGWIEPDDFDITWGNDSEYAGKKPFVKVIVSNADGSSESSDPVQVGKVIASAVNVASVYSFTATPQNTSVRLSWTSDGGNADFFEIWRWLAAEDEGNEWVLIDYAEGGGTSFEYIDKGSLPGKDYYYAVCAVYQGAYSEFAVTDDPVKIEVGQSSNLYLYDFGYDYGEITNPVTFKVVVWNDGASDINDYSLVIWAYDWNDGEIYQLSEIFPASYAAKTGQLPLRAGEEHVLSFTFNVPDEFADGHLYSWGIEIDASRDIAELYEDDNFLWSADGWQMSSGWRRSAKESSATKIGRARLFAPKIDITSRKKEENFVGPIRFKKPSFCIDHAE